MSGQFESGCYLLIVHADGTYDADDRPYKKRADAERAKRQLLAVFPETIVFIHRARSSDELRRKRLSRLCVISHRAVSVDPCSLSAR